MTNIIQFLRFVNDICFKTNSFVTRIQSTYTEIRMARIIKIRIGCGADQRTQISYVGKTFFTR